MALNPKDQVQDRLGGTVPARSRAASNAAPVADDRSSRASRFLARLDIHLSTISDQRTRRAFLDSQLEGWERRYARFIATDGASEPVADPTDPPQAADFLLTITGLAARRSALGNDARTTIMTEGPKPAIARPLG